MVRQEAGNIERISMIEVVCRHVLRIEPWKPLAEPKATNSRRYGGCPGILTFSLLASDLRVGLLLCASWL